MPLNKFEMQDLGKMLTDLQEYEDAMNSKERKFFDDMVTRFEKYGSEIFISSAQYSWLDDLKEKYVL